MLSNTFLLNTIFDKRWRKGKIKSSSIKESGTLKEEEEQRRREEVNQYKNKIAKEIQTSLTLLSTLLSYHSTLLFIVGDSTSVLREMCHSLPEAIYSLHKKHKKFNDDQSGSLSSVNIVPHYAVVSGPVHCAYNKCYVKIESSEKKDELVKSNVEHRESMEVNDNNDNDDDDDDDDNDDKVDNDVKNKTREDDNAKDGYEWTEHFLEEIRNKAKNKCKANLHEKLPDGCSCHMKINDNSNICIDKVNDSNLPHVRFPSVASAASMLEKRNEVRKLNMDALEEEGNDIYNRITSNSIKSWNKVKYDENYVRWFLTIFITSLNDISEVMHKWSPSERFKHFRQKSTMKILCFVNTDLFEEIDEVYYERWFAGNIMPKKEKFIISNAADMSRAAKAMSEIILLSVPAKYNYNWDVYYSALKTFINNNNKNNNHEGNNIVNDNIMNYTKNNELTFTTPITWKRKIVNNNHSDNIISMCTHKYPALHLQSIHMKEFSEIVENEWRSLHEKKSCQKSKARKSKYRDYADDISLNAASEFFKSLRRQTGQNREVGVQEKIEREYDNNYHKKSSNHFENCECNELVQNTSKSNSLVQHREHCEKCNTNSKIKWWMHEQCKPLIFATAENVRKAYANAHDSNRVEAKTIIHLTNTYNMLPSEIDSSALAQMTPRCYYPLVTQLGSLLSTKCCMSDIYLLQFNDKVLHINNEKIWITNENAWVCDEATNKRFSMFSAQLRVVDRELCNSTYHYMRSNVRFSVNNSYSTCTDHMRSCEENLYFAIASFVKTLLSTRLVLLWRVANSSWEHVKFAMCVSYEHYPLQWATIKKRQVLMRREMRRHSANEFEPVWHENNSQKVTYPVVESLSTQLEWVMQALRIRGWVVIAQDTHEQQQHEFSLHSLAESEQVKENVGTHFTPNVEELTKSDASVERLYNTEPTLKCVSANNNTILEEDVNAKGQNDSQEHRLCEQECTCESICTNQHSNWQLWQAALVPESFDMHLWVGQHVFLLDGRCGVVHSFLPPPLELLDAGVQEFFSSSSPPSPSSSSTSLRLSHYGLTNECHNTTDSALTLHKPEIYYDDEDIDDDDDDDNNTNSDKRSTINNAKNNDSRSNNRYWIEQAYAHATFLKWYIPNVYARKRQWTCKDGKVVMIMKDDCEYNNELVPHSLYDKFTLPDYLEKMECHAWPIIQICKTKELIHILPTDVRIGKIDYPTLCYVSAEERMQKEHKLNNGKKSDLKREDECWYYERNKCYEDATWQMRITSKNCRATIAMLPIRTKAYYSVFDVYLTELFESLEYKGETSIATSNQFMHKEYYEKYKTRKHGANKRTSVQNHNCITTIMCSSTPHISPLETELVVVNASKYKLEWSRLHQMRTVCNYRSIVDIDKKMSTYLTSATHTSLEEYTQ